jgi:hypothetical protein
LFAEFAEFVVDEEMLHLSSSWEVGVVLAVLLAFWAELGENLGYFFFFEDFGRELV